MKFIRLATLLFPPLGLLLLWRYRELRLARKIFGTLGIGLWSAIYLAGVVALLVWFNVMEVEWRGGFPPVVTLHKTKPDYDAVDAHRRAQTAAVRVEVSVFSNYWTGFRGPIRDGHYTEQPIRTDWIERPPKLLWKQPCGGGYASFAIADGLAFTIEQRRANEVVAAYDMANGREVWAHSYPAMFTESMGGEGPRATPTWADGKVYSLGGLGDFHCLDARFGRVLWSTNLLTANFAVNTFFGQSAAPLVVDGRLIVQPGGVKNHSVVACDPATGAPVWGALNDRAAYTSPMLVTLAGQRQLLVVTTTRAVGLRVEDGALLWEFPWVVQYDNAIAQPVLAGTNRFVLSAGYGTGAVCVEVVPKAEGQKQKAETEFTTHEVWRNKFLKNKFTSSVFHDGFIYGLDEDILTCLNVATGERQWKDGRYGYGQLLLASGHLVILCGNGDLALVKATAERHIEIARLPALAGKTWNHPALSGGKLLVRNAVEMACYDLTR